MLKTFKKWLFWTVTRLESVLDVLEVFLAILVVIAFIICMKPVLQHMPELAHAHDYAHSFNVFLEHLLEMVIGIEFVKMLIKHTPSSILEVLFFAIARHMVVKETSAVENLIGVLSIAVLFAIRRYLYVSSIESSKGESTVEWLEPNKTAAEIIHKQDAEAPKKG